MKNLGYTRDLLLVLFVVYYSQGSLYTQGSMLSQGSLALILSISGSYFVKTLFFNNKNSFYKAWTALLLLNIIGFIFTATYSNSLHFGMFKGIIISSLPFYPFYYFSQKGILNSKHLIRFFIFMLPITVLRYFFNANEILLERTSTNTDLVNNIAYSFVALIPFVFLFKRKKIFSIISMIVLMFFIIQGSKRGALIAGTIGLLSFLYFQLKTVERKNRFRSYLIVLIGIIGLSYFAYDIFQNNEYLISRMQRIGEEGGSSGRNIIYENIFNGWYNSDSFINLLFGFGFAASLKLSGTGNFAHNDWLELLSNFGLLGITIYGALFYSAVKYIRYQKWDIDKRLIMLTIVLIWFFTTLVSMSYTSTSGYTQSVLLAYLVGNKSNNLV